MLFLARLLPFLKNPFVQIGAVLVVITGAVWFGFTQWKSAIESAAQAEILRQQYESRLQHQRAEFKRLEKLIVIKDDIIRKHVTNEKRNVEFQVKTEPEVTVDAVMDHIFRDQQARKRQ